VEAVAFAGAGWVFGKEVHRAEAQAAAEQVQTERGRASQAEDSARQASDAAQAERLRGARLVQAVETARTATAAGAPRRRAGGVVRRRVGESAGSGRRPR
jgi:hypothetical protein